jgi:hypothetical protein
MGLDSLHLRITFATAYGEVPVLLSTSPGEIVSDLIARLVREFGLQGSPTAWQLVFEGRVLSPDVALGSTLPSDRDPIQLILRPIEPLPTQRVPTIPVPAAPGAPPAAAPMPGGMPVPARTAPADTAAPPAPARERVKVPEFRGGRVRGLDDEEAEMDDRPRKSKTSVRTTTERRATVRYYSRMNPDRVFPLLVMLTRNEVEKVVKRHVEQQATGPITLDADTPIEIEPVLPGCVCHPPKIVTRLGSADEVFTFYVVPHVLGSVTGAKVMISQDHTTLAEIKLDIRVVQRTMVLISGLSAIFLPTASAVLNHFGINFAPKDGSNPYLTAMNFLFGHVTPEIMMVVLAALTGVFYWFTRPKGRDVFWDITTKPPSK